MKWGVMIVNDNVLPVCDCDRFPRSIDSALHNEEVHDVYYWPI
jgi:hypothetical protein